MKKFKTVFCDIDGTIFEYRQFNDYSAVPAKLTPGTLIRLQEWTDQGHMIILTTARPESLREHTEEELRQHEVPWDKLVMGIERGPRYLINDESPSDPRPRANGICLQRDQGLWDVSLGDD